MSIEEVMQKRVAQYLAKAKPQSVPEKNYHEYKSKFVLINMREYFPFYNRQIRVIKFNPKVLGSCNFGLNFIHNYMQFTIAHEKKRMKPMFIGKYQAKIDKRGAVKLPKSFLEYLNECKKSSGMIFFAPGNCLLRGYPEEDAEEIIRNMNKVKNGKNHSETMAFTRFTVKHGFVEYTVDGRIIIPEAIMKISRLSIGENIYVIGLLKYFEIISAEVMDKIEEDAKKNSDLQESSFGIIIVNMVS